MKRPPKRNSGKQFVNRRTERVSHKPVEPVSGFDIPIPRDSASEKWIASHVFGASEIDPAVFVLKKEDFFDEAYWCVFKWSLEYRSSESKSDAIAMVLGKLKKVRTTSALEILADIAAWQMYAVGSVSYHVARLKLVSNVRRMSGVLSSVLSIMDECPDDAVQRFDKAVADYRDSVVDVEPEKLIGDVVFDTMDDIEARMNGRDVVFLPTGFDWVDYEFGGFERGDNIVLAAGTGVGKSAFATNIAVNNCRVGRSVVIISLEMQPVEVVNRMIGIMTGINLEDIKHGRISCEERKEITGVAGVIADWKLGIYSPAKCTAADVVSICEKHRMKFGLDLVVLDYLGLLDADKPKDPRHEQVEQLSRDVKKMAVKMQCPVLNIHQLNREAAKKGEKPKLHHLKSSGSIEQDANAVIFLHSDKPYEDEPDVEIIFAKNRSGRQHIFDAKFIKSQQRFVKAYWRY